MTTWAGTSRELDRLINEIELWTTAQAAAVASLTRTGGDTTEAVHDLYEHVDRLTDLRRERAIIERLSQIKPGIQEADPEGREHGAVG